VHYKKTALVQELAVLKMAKNNSRNMYEWFPTHGQVQFHGNKLIYIVFVALPTIATA
jgi:hypothetical protein